MAKNLTFKHVENIKTPGRYTDALVKGLHIWVKPNLKKYWIFRYTTNGKQHNISLDPYHLTGSRKLIILAALQALLPLCSGFMRGLLAL